MKTNSGLAPIDPGRVAAHTIYGFLYQTALAVECWLDIAEDQLVFCEGDEDFDRVGGQTDRVAVQAKAYSGRLGICDAAVRHSLLGFRNTFVARLRQGATERFRFVTTAVARERGEGARVLQEWADLGATDQVVAFVKRHLHDSSQETAWLDQDPERWRAFVAAVTWSFNAPGLDRVLDGIESQLGRNPHTQSLPAELLTRRLIYELLDASRHREPAQRCRSRADLLSLFGSTREQLVAWAADPLVSQHLIALQDARKLSEMLDPGTRDQPAPGEVRTVGQLLGAAYAIVPWSDKVHGDVVQEIQSWCDNRITIEAELLIGDGGSGKTRLAIELIKRMRHAGWQAGFVSNLAPVGGRNGSEHEEFLREKALILLRGAAPRLLVVDYAETQMAWISVLLQVVAEKLTQWNSAPVRIVLIARNAQDWWLAIGSQRPSIGDIQQKIPVRVLADVPIDGVSREELFGQALHEFRRVLGSDASGNRPRLSDDLFGRVLYLHMAALACVDGATAYGRDSLLRETAAHERRLWARAVERHGVEIERRPLQRAFPRAAAALTLLQGAVNEADAYRYLTRALSVRGPKDEHVAVPALVPLLRSVYAGGRQRFLAPVEPDVLGEFLVGDVLEEDERDPRNCGEACLLLDALFPEASDSRLPAAFVVLGRAAAEDPRHDKWIAYLLAPHPIIRIPIAVRAALEVGAKTAHSPMGIVVAQALAQIVDTKLAEELDVLVPNSSVSLREVGVWASQRLVAVPMSSDASEQELRRRGQDLARMAHRLSELGLRGDALRAAREANAIWSRLAIERPGSYCVQMVLSLVNLSSMMVSHGYLDEARSTGLEAVKCWQRLDVRSYVPGIQEIAEAMNNLGVCTSRVGLRREACQFGDEAVAMYRFLAALSPHYESGLAMSLDNLGNALAEVGRYREALHAAEQAVELYGTRARANPDELEPHFAVSLNNLGGRLIDVGRNREALLVVNEAVALYRRLAALRPVAFGPTLACFLSNLSNRLKCMGQHQEALRAALEAVDLHRGHVAHGASNCSPELAMALTAAAGVMEEVGKHEEALEAIREAVELRRHLAQEMPEMFEPDLALSLYNWGCTLNSLGRLHEAVEVTAEAVAIRRRLFERHPDAFALLLARALNNLGAGLSDLGRVEEALGASKEAMQVYVRVAETRPHAIAEGGSLARRNYIAHCKAAGKEPDSSLLTSWDAAFAKAGLTKP